jgi:RHS repeat-associated protein
LDISGSLQGAGGVGGLLVAISSTDEHRASFFAYDGNGNIASQASGTDGSFHIKLEYGPFGELITMSGGAFGVCSFAFSTKYLDEESGLLYYGLRYYSPHFGRWTSKDPIGDVAFRVHGWVSHRILSSSFDYNSSTAFKNCPVSLIDILGATEYSTGDPTGGGNPRDPNGYVDVTVAFYNLCTSIGTILISGSARASGGSQLSLSLLNQYRPFIYETSHGSPESGLLAVIRRLSTYRTNSLDPKRQAWSPAIFTLHFNIWKATERLGTLTESRALEFGGVSTLTIVLGAAGARLIILPPV